MYYVHYNLTIPYGQYYVHIYIEIVALTKLLLCHNTCPILAFSGFPESPGSFASFTYGQLENQGIGSHPKIHPPGLVSDFQAAALSPQRRSS